MKPRIDIELLEAFAGSFVLLDELLCPHDRHPPPALVDSTLSEDWSLVRWRPTRLDIPRVGISDLRRAGRLPQLFESFAESYAWLDVDLRVCRFFANPPTTDFTDLSTAMFADPVLNDTLLHYAWFDLLSLQTVVTIQFALTCQRSMATIAQLFDSNMNRS